jgi:DNA mismatch endonuclease (patch repair protein)
MARVRRRDTAPELALRRILHARGLRYRVDRAPLPDLARRRADLVFGRARVAVFVDGCFWHGCPEHATMSKTNSDWWASKLAGNVRRDRDTDRRLANAGWSVVRIWEHEDPNTAAEKVGAAVAGFPGDARRVDRGRMVPVPDNPG